MKAKKLKIMLALQEENNSLREENKLLKEANAAHAYVCINDDGDAMPVTKWHIPKAAKATECKCPFANVKLSKDGKPILEVRISK